MALMSSTGTTTCELERLARAGVDDGDLAVRPDAAEEAGDRLERPLRGADRPIRCGGSAPSGAEALEPLQAQGEVGAALRAGDRVDLVDDHVLDAAQDLAGLAREQQVQALGGRDEDVRRRGGRSRGGPRPACRRSGWRPRCCGGSLAEPLGREADAGQRRPQVALDVVGQGLERRDVQDADVAGLAALRAAGSGRGRAGRGTTGTRPGSCRSPSARG